MKRTLIATFTLVLILTFFANAFAVKVYHPKSTNPLHEYWRWKHFPEMNTKGVRCMVEASSGEMWFGVDKGVMHYDGLDWTLFTPDDGLCGMPVNCLKVASDGSIYAGSESGLSRYSEGKWKNVFPQDTSLIFSVRSICELPDGAILCGLDKGLLYLKNDQTLFYGGQALINQLTDRLPGVRFIPIHPKYMIGESFWVDDIFLDLDKKLWLGIGYENGLSGKLLNAVYNPSAPVPIQFKLRVAEPESKQFFNGLKIYQTKDKRIWVITQQHDHGLRYFDGEKETYLRLSNQFGGDDIHCTIIQTNDGTVWIGGLGRLFAYKNKEWILYRSPDVPVPPSNRLLLFEAMDGTIWIAGKRNELFQFDYTAATWVRYRGLNFACIDQMGHEWFLSSEDRLVCHSGDQWLSYGVEDGLMDNVEVLLLTRSGRLWAGGSHRKTSATAYLDGERWQRQIYPKLSWGVDFRGMYEDSDGALWIGGSVDIQRQQGQIGGIIKIPNPDDAPTEIIHFELPQSEISVYGIGQSRDGRMWLAGINSCWFDGTKWQVISNPPELANHSDALYTSKSGEIWYGSRNYGIFRFDGEKWRQYTVEDGLLSNSIKSIYVESDSSVWVATDKDISRFDGKTWTNRIFPEDLTILHEGGDLKPGIAGQIWINKSSRKWHRRVLNQTQDKKANTDVWTVRFNKNMSPPETWITMFDPTVYQPGNTIISWRGVDRWKNTPDEQIQYSYRMDDNEWSNFTEKTSQIFLELATGAHIFKVRARDRDFNIDPTPVEVHLNVELPFYLQPAFLIPVILLTILSIFLEIRVIGKNKKLQAVKKETDNILQNVEEGLFLLNPAYEIGNQHSSALENLFEHENLARVNFIDLIKDKINKKQIETVTDYLDVAFNIDTPDSVLEDLNPLNDIRMDFAENKYKYLNFKFSKIDTDSGSTKHLIVTVNDITEEKRLAQELKITQEKSERQMNWLLTLLQVEPKLLQEFLLEVQDELNKVRDILLKEKDPGKLPELLEKIYRSIHLVKGNSSMLTLTFFTEQAHELEDSITLLQDKKSISTNDLLSLNKGLDGIQVSIDTASGLLDRIGQIHSQMRPKRSHENKIILQSFQNLVSQLAADTGKNIELQAKKFSLNDIPYEKQSMVKDIMVQLLRNAVAHGIEAPEERKALGKPGSSLIQICSFKNKDEFGFSVRDDGRGLLLDKLRERVKRIGKWSEQELADWTQDQIIDTIFISGISTTDGADMISGRGVGMDLVREKMEESGSRMQVQFEAGQFCEFTLHCPLTTRKT